jgi:hypothetical protein
VWYAIHVNFIFSVFFWTNVQSKRTTRAEPEDHLWSADHSFRNLALQQWLHERASVLRYTYIGCVVMLFSLDCLTLEYKNKVRWGAARPPARPMTHPRTLEPPTTLLWLYKTSSSFVCWHQQSGRLPLPCFSTGLHHPSLVHKEGGNFQILPWTPVPPGWPKCSCMTDTQHFVNVIN